MSRSSAESREGRSPRLRGFLTERWGIETTGVPNLNEALRRVVSDEEQRQSLLGAIAELQEAWGAQQEEDFALVFPSYKPRRDVEIEQSIRDFYNQQGFTYDHKEEVFLKVETGGATTTYVFNSPEKTVYVTVTCPTPVDWWFTVVSKLKENY